jgi:DNA-binding HxlR family transcriptional regulator
VSISLDIIGDRWSLLIVRDMMVRGYRTFREFQSAGEGIATNILSDRLQRLEASGIVEREAAEDRRSTYFRLTAKGIALAPVLLEMLIWGARNEKTDAPCATIEQMEQNRAAVIAETYRRWEQRDTTPLIPPFTAKGNATNTKNKTRNRKNEATRAKMRELVRRNQIPRKEEQNDEGEYLSELPGQLRGGD